MKFHKNKLLTTVAAAALALAVGACSSSSDDEGMSMLQTDLDAAIATAAALQEDLDEANADLETANGMVTDLQGQLDTANADLMTSNDNADAIQAMLDTASGDVTRLNADLMTSNDNADAIQAMLDTASGDVTRLNADLMTSNDNADAIQAMLDTASGDVTRLNADLMTSNDNADAIQAMLDTASGDVTRLTGELTDANDNADTIQTTLDTASGDVTRLTGELTDANDNADTIQTMLDTASGDVTRLTGELADANTRADTAEGEVTRLKGELGVANARITEIEMLAGDVLAAAALADRIAREDMIQMAITASLTAPDDDPSEFDGVTAKRGAAGMVAVTVSDEDYTGGETTAGTGNWNGATLTKDTNTLVVYTDIEAPSDKLLTLQYVRVELDMALTFTGATDQREGKAQSNGFPSEPGTTWMYTGEVEDGGRAKTVAGTFDGVPGHFACGEATCTLMTDADGKLISTEDPWRFTPMAPLTATVKDPDAAYAYFGWWLDKPENNAVIHMTEVFTGAVDDEGADVTTLIQGNATYKGPAAGKYTTKTFSAGVQTDAGVGHFTASTTLTAKFGEDSGAPGTIDGMVTGFELDDGATPTWSVKLMKATLMAGENDFNGVSDATFGPTSKVGGTWEGSFYDAANAQNDEAPGTVVGTFNAVSANASLLGAFGATKQ